MAQPLHFGACAHAAIGKASAKAREWASLPAQKKLELFEQCMENAKAEADAID